MIVRGFEEGDSSAESWECLSTVPGLIHAKPGNEITSTLLSRRWLGPPPWRGRGGRRRDAGGGVIFSLLSGMWTK